MPGTRPPPFKAEIVGSLLRPPALHAARARHVRGEIDDAELWRIESAHIAEAVALHEAALHHCPDVALLHFNHAVALEDQGRFADALAGYEQALQRDHTLADAHFNAARLHDQLGHKQQAIRHFSAYRRLRDR